MKLFEIHSPPEKQDLQKLRSVLSKPLSLKKSDTNDFYSATLYANRVMHWATSMSGTARLDLSTIGDDLQSLIMRFTLTWFKKIVEEHEGSKKNLQNDLLDIKKWIRDLKFSKFPTAEIDVLYKAISTPTKKVTEGTIPDEEITITMGVRGDAKQKIAELLHYISNACSMGCSRTWGVVNGDRDEDWKVDFDGDGADKLVDVKINGQKVKDFMR